MSEDTGVVEQVTEQPVAEQTRVEPKIETPTGDTRRSLAEQLTDKGIADKLTARLGNSDRIRDEQGKFTRTDKQPEPKAEPKIEAVVTEAKPAEQVQEIKPPSTLNAQEAQLYKGMTPEQRAIIDRREGDYLKGVQQLKPAADLGRSMQQVFTPYQAMMQSEGADPVSAVTELMKMAYTLRTGTPQQKQALLLNTAKQFGIDLGAVQQAVQTGQLPQIDPILAQTQNELAEMRAWRQSMEQSQKESGKRAAENDMQAFADEKDASGNLTHPHYSAVLDEMVAHLPGVMQANPAFNRQQILKEAYDRATWANPGVRAQLQAGLALKQVSGQQAQAGQRVAQAKSAAVSITGSPGIGSSATSSDKSIRQNLIEGFANRA